MSATQVPPFETVVLAGGLGSRLREAVPHLPKPLADVGGRPFLEHVLASLAARGAGRFVLSVGYLGNSIRSRFGSCFAGIPVVYSQEDEPLGTGGALYRALRLVDGPSALVVNGDTLFRVDSGALLRHHAGKRCDVTLGLKPLEDSARYGRVEVEGARVVGFREKGPPAPGLVNGGVFAVARDLPERFPMPERFSFEGDLLAKRVRELHVCPWVEDGFFIDIGVPEDYRRAQLEWAEIAGGTP